MTVLKSAFHRKNHQKLLQSLPCVLMSKEVVKLKGVRTSSCFEKWECGRQGVATRKHLFENCSKHRHSVRNRTTLPKSLCTHNLQNKTVQKRLYTCGNRFQTSIQDFGEILDPSLPFFVKTSNLVDSKVDSSILSILWLKVDSSIRRF